MTVTVLDGYEALADAVREIAGDTTPAALVVRRGAQVVVDVSCGRDGLGRPFSSATPVFLFSAVKPVTALTVLLAVAAGRLTLDDPVALAWPAFGARGQPGEHTISYGHLIDGILRHATGRDVRSWWRDAQQATGVTIDLTAGTGARQPARLEDPDGTWRDGWLAASSRMGALLRNPPQLLDVEWLDGSEGRQLVAPAVTGYGSAHDLAGLWAWWSGDGARHRLGPALHARSVAAVISGYDHVLERAVDWGLGPQLDDGGYGMGGAGGCVGWFDRQLDLSIGFTTPRVGSLDRLDPLDDALMSLINEVRDG